MACRLLPCWMRTRMNDATGMPVDAPAHLQQGLGHLLVRDDGDEAVLGAGHGGLVAAGEVLEEDLDDAPAQLGQVRAVPAAVAIVTTTSAVPRVAMPPPLCPSS